MSFLNQRHGKSPRRRRRNSDINMTPLIDVMMVLLIIFMIAAPLMTTGIALDLPRVGGQSLDTESKSLNVSVDKEGRFYIGEDEIPAEEIVTKLRAILGANNQLSVTISGDTATEYGRVIGLMALLKEAGFERVGLKTESRPPLKRR
jgi:biopolymer transport protein TolR